MYISNEGVKNFHKQNVLVSRQRAERLKALYAPVLLSNRLVSQLLLISFRTCIIREVTADKLCQSVILASSFVCSSFVVVISCDFDSSTDFMAACVSPTSLKIQPTTSSIPNSHGITKFFTQKAGKYLTYYQFCHCKTYRHKIFETNKISDR